MELKGTEAEYRKQMAEKAKDGTLKPVDTNGAAKAAPKRRGRWDQTEETPAKTAKKPASSFFQAEGSATPGAGDATPGRQAWAETPGRDKSSETPGHAGSATPGGASSRRNRWDETPRTDRETTANAGWAETPRSVQPGDKIISETPTPSASKRRSRWDETPGATPSMLLVAP